MKGSEDVAISRFQSLLVGRIERFVAESPENRLAAIDGSPIFDSPLVGFADGDDPLFAEYKRIIGEFHLTPREALGLHAGDASFPHVAVISWILPIAEATRRSNAAMEVGPSVRWNHTRFKGEDFNNALKRFVVDILQKEGHAAVAPGLAPSFRTVELDNGLASTWSERHIAFAAGLGTFGLSDGLITPKGMAMRCGSVVAALKVVATPRSYQNHTAYCPFLQDGSCGVCIDRCPADAISPQGHDKKRCRDYVEFELKSWVERSGERGYIGAYPACGLCQTGVPCEARIP